MRIAVFGPGHPYRGGIARTTTELVRTLVARGHEARFFTPRRQYPQWLYPGEDDRDPDACPRLSCAEAILDPLSPASWPRAKARACEVGADLWVVPYWTWAWAGWWRYLLGTVGRPPAVAVVHNLMDHDAGPMHRLAAHMVLGRCQALFTHAQSLRDRLATVHAGVPVAAHPLPPILGEIPERSAARAALGVAEDTLLGLFLGLIRPYKGVDVLLEAVAALEPDSRWFVVIAGEPWRHMADEIRRRVVELGIGHRIRLSLRWIPEVEVPTLLAAADLVVLPYRQGSQSAVAPLALGCGVPVLSTAVGGLPEVVHHRCNGYLVEPGSVDALTRALHDLDGPLLTEICEGARGSRELLSWDTYSAQLEGLFERVAP